MLILSPCLRGITYVLAGTVEHGDSMGNRGSTAAGDVQWMTAGSGIIHQEMPKGDSAGSMHGFQLWANLPADLKMTAPRYQEVKASDIPVITDDDGTHVRIICGSFWGTKGHRPSTSYGLAIGILAYFPYG
jgi:quercetin 2,3-dioxygenase